MEGKLIAWELEVENGKLAEQRKKREIWAPRHFYGPGGMFTDTLWKPIYDYGLATAETHLSPQAFCGVEGLWLHA